jgi:hypothetical protein
MTSQPRKEKKKIELTIGDEPSIGGLIALKYLEKKSTDNNTTRRRIRYG